MKNFTDNRIFSTLLFFLIVALIAKTVWIVVSMLLLPSSGVEQTTVAKSKPLYYRIKLANKSKEIRPVTSIKKTPTIGTMRGINLLALYSATDTLIVTVEKVGKTKVLAKGEAIDGFILSSAGSSHALFKKGGKEFKLMLKGSKYKESKRVVPTVSVEEPRAGITPNDYGTGKVVSRDLLSSYTKDIDKVWRDIGIGEYKVDGKLQGFKINFVKKNSDFAKLDLRRGDILHSVNGQELTSYNAAFSFYKNMEAVENLTLGIKRDNQDMELEYEIQ